VCALPKELTAARAMLDEEHEESRSQGMDTTEGIEFLADQAALDDDRAYSNSDTSVRANIGLGLHGLNDHERLREARPDLRATPAKISGWEQNDLLTTPVPRRGQYANDLDSSLSVMPLLPAARREEPGLAEGTDFPDMEDIDWSQFSRIEINDEAFGLARQLYPPFSQSLEDGLDELSSNRRSSIFDWSGHDRSSSISLPGISHGNQSDKMDRVKSSGHVNNTVNRDSTSDADMPSSRSKFGTWGLGSRPVREEWDDDFEFDDFDGPDQSLEVSQEIKNSYRESVRSAKVPQSIIDRQAKVHGQFGHSRRLWDEAESMINLATVNEDEDFSPLHVSTSTVLSLGEDTSLKQLAEDAGHQAGHVPRLNNQPSISSSASSPYGRAHGESIQSKTLLHTTHPNRIGLESPPEVAETRLRKDLMQELPDLVVRARVISQAPTKEIERKSKGVLLGPEKTPVKSLDPTSFPLFEPPPHTGLIRILERHMRYIRLKSKKNLERGPWEKRIEEFGKTLVPISPTAVSAGLNSDSDIQQLQSRSDGDFVGTHGISFVISPPPLVEGLSDDNNKSDNNDVNAFAHSSLKASMAIPDDSSTTIFDQTAMKASISDWSEAVNTTSFDTGGDSFGDIPEKASGEISKSILANNRTGTSEETTDFPRPIIENAPEIASDKNSVGNTSDQKNADFPDETLTNAPEEIFPATIDETPHPIPSPLSVIYRGVNPPSQESQVFSESDLIDYSMPEAHESLLTTLKSTGILKSVMNGLTHITSILGSHMQGVGKQRSVRITWKCVSSNSCFSRVLC
jgi:hypothetical protein